MEIESLSQIEILANGEMHFVLESGGKPEYQYIYREAREVYWDDSKSSFKAPPPREWSYADWFNHIMEVTKSIGIKLVVTESTVWKNVPTKLKDELGH